MNVDVDRVRATAGEVAPHAGDHLNSPFGMYCDAYSSSSGGK